LRVRPICLLADRADEAIPILVVLQGLLRHYIPRKDDNFQLYPPIKRRTSPIPIKISAKDFCPIINLLNFFFKLFLGYLYDRINND